MFWWPDLPRMPAMRYSIADTAGFTCELAGFDLSDVNGFVFIRFFPFGQSKDKADKFSRVFNMLDVLRESSILMSVGLICLDFASRAKKMHQDARFSDVQSIAADVTW